MLFPFICLSAFVISHFAVCQNASAPVAEQKNEGVYRRDVGQNNWKQLNKGKEIVKGKIVTINYGDIIAVKDESLLIELGKSRILVSPFSVLRINGVTEESGEYKQVPDLLFGEAVVTGPQIEISLPGQTVIASDTVYITVDADKYSIVGAITGNQSVMPIGAPEPIKIESGNYLELGPSGEAGTITPLTSEDIELYSKKEVPEDTPLITINIEQKPSPVEQIQEFWSRERVTLLEDGPESEAGLAIARGDDRKNETTSEGRTVQAFDQEKGPTQKSLSFSTSVSAAGAIGSIPVLNELKIGGRKVSAGETLSVGKDILDSEKTYFPITGRITVANAGDWKFYIKINDEESRLDSPSNFEKQVKIQRDTLTPPSIAGVRIAEKSADNFNEFSVLTRENLVSGKIEVSGAAVPGQNILNYSIEVIAKDKEETETPLGKVAVILDLSAIEKVEVSIDNGMGWEKANGTTDWRYSFRPTDEEKYKIKVQATDVIGHTSEKQFEPYILKYSYKTDEEKLKNVFDTMMRAFLDEDRTTFMKSVSQEFSSNIEDIRDYNELDSSIRERFSCCNIKVQYTIQDIDAMRESEQGTVGFFWKPASSASDNIFATFNYKYIDGEWKLSQVIDDNTFLRASRMPYSIVLRLEKTRVTADGADTCEVTAEVYDIAGAIVADDLQVTFSADKGTLNPTSDMTNGGLASTTYTAPTVQGNATITATSGRAHQSITLILDPVAPPLPPD